VWVLAAVLATVCLPVHAQSFAGDWEGTTAQGKDLELTVTGGTVTRFSFGGMLSGGCTAEFTTTSNGSLATISGSSFSFSGGSSAPGAVSYTATGTFTSGVSATGTLSFSLHAIPGVPSCAGSGNTTWTATRTGGPPPQLSIGDVSVVEGDNGVVQATFPVTLSGAAAGTVTVGYTTNEGTADGGGDFQHTSGTLTFGAGQTSKTVTVDVLGDTLVESNETFFVDLSGASGATLADARGQGTIVDDDATAPEPPPGTWLATPAVPGFRVKVRVGGPSGIAGLQVTPCIGETLCVSGAVANRAEVFVRVVGPKPNGKLWPTLVKFSTSRIEVWIEQTSRGIVRYYDLAAGAAGEDQIPLTGLADKLGFDP
jgi:hypothetical protein